MRYNLNIDKAVNELVYFGLRGRRHILFLQSILSPLKDLNDTFVTYAKEKHIEARMTSQNMYFEWFLNHKLGKYFRDPTEKITLIGQNGLGLPVYNRPQKETFVIWQRDDTNKDHPKLYHKTHELQKEKYNFTVSCPDINEESADEFLYALKYWVDKYKTAGKTYIIKLKS